MRPYPYEATPQALITRGFTLVELSITLVIIGLLVGGILLGKDMVRSAEIRSTIADVEKLKTAINTFKLKYNCLPGDCANATDYFVGATNGNGNGVYYLGMIESYNAQIQLGSANLWPSDGNAGSPTLAIAGAIARQKGFGAIYSNDLYIGGSQVALGTQYGNTISLFRIVNGKYLGVVFDGPEAYIFDSKFDDGQPTSGKVIGLTGYGTSLLQPAVLCTTGGEAYNVMSTGTYDLSATAGCRIVVYW